MRRGRTRLLRFLFKKKLFGTLHFDYIEISLLLKIYKKKISNFLKKSLYKKARRVRARRVRVNMPCIMITNELCNIIRLDNVRCRGSVKPAVNWIQLGRKGLYWWEVGPWSRPGSLAGLCI